MDECYPDVIPLSLLANTTGVAINTLYPLAKRLDTYVKPNNYGVLDIQLTASFYTPAGVLDTTSLGVLVVIGTNDDTITVTQDSRVYASLMFAIDPVNAEINSNSFSTRWLHKGVKVPAGSPVSLYGFMTAAANATVIASANLFTILTK